MIGGWPLSVAAAALAAVATLSRQALVLNSVEAARQYAVDDPHPDASVV